MSHLQLYSPKQLNEVQLKNILNDKLCRLALIYNDVIKTGDIQLLNIYHDKISITDNNYKYYLKEAIQSNNLILVRYYLLYNNKKHINKIIMTYFLDSSNVQLVIDVFSFINNLLNNNLELNNNRTINYIVLELINIFINDDTYEYYNISIINSLFKYKYVSIIILKNNIYIKKLYLNRYISLIFSKLDYTAIELIVKHIDLSYSDYENIVYDISRAPNDNIKLSYATPISYKLRNVNYLINIFKKIIKSFKTKYGDGVKLKKLIIENLNLNTIASIKNGHLLLKLLNKYIDDSDYSINDDSNFYPLHDAARYSSFPTFLYVLKKSHIKCYKNKEYDNILYLSFFNNDERIFKYICNKAEILSLINFNSQNNENLYMDIPCSIISANFNKNKKMYKNIKYFVNKFPFIKNKILNRLIITQQLSNDNFLLKILDIDFTINFNLYDIYLYNIYNYCNENVINKILEKTDSINNYKFLLYVNLKNEGNIHSPICKKLILKLGEENIDYNQCLEIICVGKLHYYQHYSIEETEIYFKSLFELSKKINYNYNFNKIISNLNIKYLYNSTISNFRLLFFAGIQLDLIFGNEKINNKELKKYINCLKFLKKCIRKKYNKQKIIHTNNYNKTVNYFNFKKKINLLKKKNNPIHLNPCNFLEYITNNNVYYLSPKADGIYSKLRLYNCIPNINIFEIKSINFEAELITINDKKIYMLFSNYDEIDYLRKLHPFTKNNITPFINNINDIIEFYKNETNNFNEFLKSTTNDMIIWWPKPIFKYDVNTIDFNELKNYTIPGFNIDGWILMGNITNTILKLKPNNHLTIDLLYKNDAFYYDNDIKFNDIKFNDIKFNDIKFNDIKFNDIKFNDIKFNPLELVSGNIYRCHYNDNENDKLWIPKTIRHDKVKPNNKNIVNEILNYFDLPWNINNLKKYICNYYQNYNLNTKFKLINKDENLKNIISNYFYNNSNTIDIGCGFKTRKYMSYNNCKNYIGIDIDYNIIQKLKKGNKTENGKYYCIDFNNDWHNQIRLFNETENFDNNYDNILCLNSIQNVINYTVFNKYIDKISKKKSRFIIKFLDNSVLSKILKHGETIKKDTNFVRYYGNTDKIKYYYSHVHYKPIIENVYNKEKILEILNNKWNLIKYISYDIDKSSNLFEQYFRCFSIIVLEKK